MRGRAGLVAGAVLASALLGVLCAARRVSAEPVPYDVVYVRQPRYGDQTNTTWPEVFHPARIDPGADLVLLHPDGSEEVLVAGGIESDPLSPAPGHDYLGYGIVNLGPAPVAGGKVAFTSNRNGFAPPKGFTSPSLQLYVMDEDGANVTPIAPMNVSSALHPTPLRDGRLLFSSHESQGLRDARLWGVWAIWPDGRKWEPIVSAFRDGQAFHFMTQLSNEDLVVVDYYNLNNNGFGALYRMPVRPPAGEPRFHSAFPADNPPTAQTVGQGFSYPFRMPFTPRGLHSITPFTHGNDEAAPVGAGGVRVGKFTHPSAAPGNDLLVVWTPGPANDLDRPTPTPRYDAGVYLLRDGGPVTSPSQLVLLKNDPAYDEAWPRAVVRYRDVHGVDEPAELPWLPNDGSLHAELPAGTPYGLVGTSSLYKRESFPGWVTSWSDTFDGLDAFNTAENGKSSNWVTQGAAAGKYTNADVWAVRILAMEPGTHRSYGPNGGPSGGQLFTSHAMERLRILGEIPVRKRKPDGTVLRDAEGNPDTSFLVKIPADTPFTFQTLDRDGLVLNMAQTWHQVRPGEMRADCGGCHAHSQQPLAFEGTAAARADYQVADLSASTPLLTRDAQGNPGVRTVAAGVVDVEFYRDVRPILTRSCVPCHTQSAAEPPGNLVLDDYASYGGPPGDYARLAADQDARWGHPPLIGWQDQRWWRQTNASRYVRMFQSRRSLLAWKVFGRRLDGWTNDDHPTEGVPGYPSTLPAGADPNEADLDYTGTIMPPPGSGVPPLGEDEKITIARWIDLGAPINSGANGATPWGWFLDEVRPTLEVSLPRPGANAPPLERVRIGVADVNSGVEPGSLSLVADFPLAGRAAGDELADLLAPLGGGIHELALAEPLAELDEGHLLVQVADRQGNWTRVDRRFSVGEAADPGPRPNVCDAAPRSCVAARRAALRLNAATRKLLFTWQGDEAAASAAFGDPVSGTTGFALCAYDAGGAVLGEGVLAGGTCGGGACWKRLAGGGLRYRDAAGSRGVTRLVLKPAAAGKARIRVEGGKASLDLPALPLGTLPVAVQLVRRDDPTRCWQAEFASHRVNDERLFRAVIR